MPVCHSLSMFLRPRLRLPLRPRPLSRFTDCPPPPALRPLLARPYTAAATASSPKQLSCDQHDDLDSFMRYANDVDLPRETSVYVGTLYEYGSVRTWTCPRLLTTPGTQSTALSHTWGST